VKEILTYAVMLDSY